MPLFSSSDFTNTYDTPINEGALGSGVVNVTMSDGNTITVFDDIATALKCLAYMRVNKQWHLWATEDLIVVSINATKGIVMESTLVNQKLLMQYHPVYQGGEVLWSHRTLSQLLTLTDALRAVGFCHSSTTPFTNNSSLSSGNAHMTLFDWRFPSTVLSDATPLSYDFTS